MNTLIERFSITTIEHRDDTDTGWSMVWSNHSGGLVSENGDTYDQLVKALEWGEKLEGFDFHVSLGGEFIDPEA